MAISEMKKITLLAEIEHLKAVMISLQSDQAVEIIPTNSDIQRQLLNEYFEVDEESEEIRINPEIFEIQSKENDINRLTSQLDDLEESIAFMESILPSASFIEKLNQEKETFTLYELEEYMEDKDIHSFIQESQNLEKQLDKMNQRKEDLKDKESFLNRWRSLEFNPKETNDFQLTEVIVGAITSERNDELQDALNHFNEVYTKVIQYTEDETIYLVIVSEMEAHDVEQTLIRHRFERLNYQYEQLPEEELKSVREDLKVVRKEISRFEDRPEHGKELLKNLKLSEEYLFNVRERLRASEDILTSEHLFILTGWIEESTLDSQLANLKAQIGEENIYHFIDDVKESEIDDVPTKYENNKSTSAFENVVSMYSTPKYDEMDPTPFVQPFSILFFGMMTADAGYGLLGLIAVFIALKFLNVAGAMRKNLEFFGQLMIGTTLAGLFFGSFFGFELPFQVMSFNTQLLEIMVLSIGIGLLHLLIGLFLNTRINNRRGDYATSYTDGYSWMLVLLSGVAIALNAFFGGPSIINTVSVAIILLSLVGIIVVSGVAAENTLGGLGQGLFGLFDVTSYIGDVISYTRLTALGVASANIGMAFNLIINLLPVPLRFTIGVLIFIGLHLFNMFIAMISGYVHTLRLNYVEFFGKFYNGGGREFQPIPMLQKHINIKSS